MESVEQSGPNPPTVLILGVDPAARRVVGRCLDGSANILEASRPAEAAELLSRHDVDVVVLAHPRCHPAPGGDGRPAGSLRAAAGEAVILEVTHGDGNASRRHAGSSGLWDVIEAGRDPSEIRHRITRAAEHSRLRRELSRLQSDLERRFGAGSLLGSSPVMERLRRHLRKAGREESPVILCGEKGTGRERASRALHLCSTRRRGPFLAVSPGGIDSPSRVRLPRGGTLLIKDAQECRASSLSRLLRELAAARGAIRLVIAVASSDPRQEVPSRLARELSPLGRATRIDLPALRERRGDVPLLAAHFLETFRAAHGRPLRAISREAMACMEAYPWPGNVREMEDLLECMVFVVNSETLQARDLPSHLLRSRTDHALVMPAIPEEGVMWQNQLDSFQRGLLEQALTLSSGKKVEAARRLGLKKDQMKYLCRKYGL